MMMAGSTECSLSSMQGFKETSYGLRQIDEGGKSVI